MNRSEVNGRIEMKITTDDIEAVEKPGQARGRIMGKLRKTVVGMDDGIDGNLYEKKAGW